MKARSSSAYRFTKVGAAPVAVLGVELAAHRARDARVVSVPNPRQVKQRKRRHVSHQHVRIVWDVRPLLFQVP